MTIHRITMFRGSDFNVNSFWITDGWSCGSTLVSVFVCPQFSVTNDRSIPIGHAILVSSPNHVAEGGCVLSGALLRT